MRVAAIMLAIALVGSIRPGDPLELDATTHRVLVDDFRFSANDLNELSEGHVVRRTLEGAPGEIAVVGATHIDAPVSLFLARFRDIVSLKKHESVLQVGRFSDPPVLQDLDGLTIDDDVLDGRNCRVGDCDVRLPEADLVRLHGDVDWTDRAANRKAIELYKRMLFGHIQAYWNGSGRIESYAADRRPVRPVVEFAGIVANSPYLGHLIPQLPAHLARFPDERLAGSENFLYWSKQQLAFSPFVTVTHVTIAHAPGGPVVITSKDVYSSRYVDASLGLTIAAEDGEHGFLLVYANRTRANALKGFLSSLRRSVVERQARSGLEDTLRVLKTRLEEAH
jgi:hypothetical protein